MANENRLEQVVREIIADVLCDTQGITPRALEHTRMVVANRIAPLLAAEWDRAKAFYEEYIAARELNGKSN